MENKKPETIGVKLAERIKKDIEQANSNPFFKVQADEAKSQESGYFREVK